MKCESVLELTSENCGVELRISHIVLARHADVTAENSYVGSQRKRGPPIIDEARHASHEVWPIHALSDPDLIATSGVVKRVLKVGVRVVPSRSVGLDRLRSLLDAQDGRMRNLCDSACNACDHDPRSSEVYAMATKDDWHD